MAQRYFAAIRVCLDLVRTSRRLCLRIGYVQHQRRIDHSAGHGHAYGLGGCQNHPPGYSAPLHLAYGLVPALYDGKLPCLRPALSCPGHLTPTGMISKNVWSTLPISRPPMCGTTSGRAGLQLRALPGGRALRSPRPPTGKNTGELEHFNFEMVWPPAAKEPFGKCSLESPKLFN